MMILLNLKGKRNRMNNYKFGILALTFLVIAGLVSACFLGQDNPIEECVEEVIKIQTGVCVDLTPGTSEIAPEAK